MPDSAHESTPEPPGAPRRSAGKWLILLIVWGVGLVVWAFYIAILVMIAAYIS